MTASTATCGNAVVAGGARSHHLTVIHLDDRRPRAAAMTGFAQIRSRNMRGGFPARGRAVVA